MKTTEQKLRRIISYQSIDALIEHFAKYKTQTPGNCIYMIAERDWVEGVEYCLQQIPEKYKLLTCETVLKTAAEHDAINVFKTIIEYIRLSPDFKSTMDSLFRTAIGELSGKVVAFCLTSKTVTPVHAAEMLVGTVEAGEAGLHAFDEIIKVVPKDSQLMFSLLYYACDRRNLGTVKRIFKLCEEHKIILPDDQIAGAITHGVGLGPIDPDFIEGILSIPKVQKVIRKDGAMMILTAAISDDTLSIKRLIDEGVVPNYATVEYLASKVFDDSQKMGKLVYRKDDKKYYDRHSYQLGLVIPASKGAWRNVESKKAVRVLIDYFGVDSPQGQDLTAKLFLM